MWAYDIDWNATGAMLGGIGSLVAAATLVVSALLAWRSYQQWKDKEHYLEDRRLAIDMLVAFEEGRSALRSIRNNIMISFKAENIDAESGKEMCKDIEGMLGRNRETWQRIASLIPIAKVVFGEEVKFPFQQFKATIDDMKLACWAGSNDSIFFDEDSKTKIFPGVETIDDDPIYSPIAEAEKELERILTPYIRSDKKPKKADAASM